MNINLEENYWPADPANMSETIQPLIGFVKGLSTTGKHTARNFYGINEGWCAAHNSDPWCKTSPVGEGKESPEWANWNLGGAWLVNALWDHYLYSQDKQLLQNTIYPLMEGSSKFFQQWLVTNPNKPNELITAPSTSPENEYVTDKGYHGTTCYGGTADLAIIRELFMNMQQARKSLGLKPDKEMDDKLHRLHPYTVGSQGDLNEWYYDWKDYDIHHRHQSHLIGLYPGMHLQALAKQTKDSTILAAARQTLIQKGDESIYGHDWVMGTMLTKFTKTFFHTSHPKGIMGKMPCIMVEPTLTSSMLTHLSKLMATSVVQLECVKCWCKVRLI